MRLKFLSVVVCLLAAALALASDKPNLTGSWKLNLDKSDFGPMPKPDKYDVSVNHSDPELKVTTVMAGQMGERTTDATYYTDGKEATNKMGPAEVRSKGRWDGKVLVIDSTLDMQGNEIKMSERWTMADDGKIVTIDRVINAPQGDLQLKYIFEKQ